MRQFHLKFLAVCIAAATASGIHASAGDDYTWHGYYDGEEALSEYGTGMGEDYDCAIFLPGDIGAASGKTINKVRFTLQGTSDMQNVRVWLSTSLPTVPEGADVAVVDIDPSLLRDGVATEVDLPAPCRVPAGGVYVGYSFSATDPFPLLTTRSSTTEAGGFFIKTSGTYPDWKDFSQYRYGNLAVQVMLDGKIYGNAARVENVPEVVGLPGSEVAFPVKIMNAGLEGISSLTYSLQTDGGEPETFDYVFPTPVKDILQTAEIPLSFGCSSGSGISYRHFEILKVNGKDNEVADNTSGTGAVITIEESAPRTTVMEEYTGSWCGWCPRGAVAIENLKKDYGTAFIGIAIHRNDPMEIAEYGNILATVGGFPSCTLNRDVGGDPFFGSVTGPGREESYAICNDIDRQQAMLVPAVARVSSEWTDRDASLLRVVASAALSYPRADSPAYRVAYVITADSLKGSGAGWQQNNDFALTMAQGYKSDPYIGWLTDRPQLIRDYVFMDVAIAAAGIDKGFPLDAEGGWQEGEMRECGSYVFDLSENPLVQDKDNLHAAVLLIDGATGRIVNAAQAPVGSERSSALEEIEAPEGETCVSAVYDAAGRLIPAPAKGINIVRYSDGSVRKIIVKQ